MSIVTDSAFSVNGGRAAEQKRLYNLAFLERNYAILEHVLLLSAIKSYKFYALNKQRLCPRLPDGRTFRYDFTLLEYNQVYSIVGQFWETMGSMLKLTDASINADLMELQLGKRVQNGSMSGDDAHAIAKWLLLDIRTIDIAPELILTVTNTQIFNTWIEQRVIEYEQGRLRGISACRRPSLEDFEESFKAVQAARSGDVPLARRLADIPAPPQEDPNELIKHRFLCRGGGLLIAGSTGIGKSVLDNQFSISWGAGRACFGIVPTRPLKSVIIQAEDDDGDLAEMFGGVCNHLKFTPAEFELVRENVITVHDNMHSGLSFFTKVVEPVLEAYRPDLLHINPALAYLGGEANSQKDVGAFLRNHLNPLLTKYNCAAVITTHTNKPPAGKERPDWQAGDFAYAGTGSSEWANWPRGILTLRSIGSDSVFQLRASKRGKRLGWRTADGLDSTTIKHIAHSPNPKEIYWSEATADQIAGSSKTKTKKPGRPAEHDSEEVFSLLPPQGLSVADWEDASSKCGIKGTSFHRIRRALLANGRVCKPAADGNWQPTAINNREANLNP